MLAGEMLLFCMMFFAYYIAIIVNKFIVLQGDYLPS